MDENSKIVDGGVAKTAAEEESLATNPNPIPDVITSNSDSSVDDGGANPLTAANDESEVVARSRQSSRTPFANLSQADADLALARTLQEQERAYMMLSMNGGGTGFGRWETGIYIHDDEDDDFGDSHEHESIEDDEDEEDGEEDEDEEEENEDNAENYEDENADEDAFDVHAHDDLGDSDTYNVELDPSSFPDDEAYARALQDAEEREMAARLLAMAGITEREIVDMGDHGGHSQDTWEEVDPDELSYEELIALGEIVGTESRGLSADTIASLPSTNYKSLKTQDSETDSCVICRLDFEDGDPLTTLPCKHAYHSDCINNWLQINKACPICSAEVSTSGNS
ncbi:E3 ubiquitin ligase BIG BROTHER-related-like [Amaranthus tricolor]|uniref:E3 ubiquitin ligase BIG BROTHER-related-like n=1 Tax=Amaranthus tricolor TaxID=29722 RepID=UPI002587FCAF|nr:E3 ubiquitin ligase BIG BROTHER-related-like [Amaranthus tricolor]